MPRTRGASAKPSSTADDTIKGEPVKEEVETPGPEVKDEAEPMKKTDEEEEVVPPPSSAPGPTPAPAATTEKATGPKVEEGAATISIEVGGPASEGSSAKEANNGTTTTSINNNKDGANKKDREPVKVIPAVPIPEPEPDPHVPSNRDVCVGFDTHIGTMLLQDLIRIHYYLWKRSGRDLPKDESDVSDLATRLTSLVMKGKKYELSGLKDVPKPFFKGEGRFFEKSSGGGETTKEWKRLDEDGARTYVTHFILAQFKAMDEEPDKSGEMKDSLDVLYTTTKADPGEEPHSAPRPCDVLFLPTEYPWEENMAYEHQVGNKHLLFLASQHVSGESKESDKRVDAAFKLVTSKIEVNSGTDLVPKTPRYVIQRIQDGQNSWHEMPREDLAEFAVIFVFEVFLEKQIHGVGTGLTSSSSATTTTAVADNVSAAAAVSTKVAGLISDTSKATETPIDTPTTHDVLFGRGGMTNGHPGNRRFRDVIALHRPDYIRATKMDKPNVARRIVRAIRQGNPPGRFLRKNDDDGKWYDVGDKVAAEKTSQGLRERSNAEKRQRSALREALRIRKEDLADNEDDNEDGDGGPSAKKAKVGAGTVSVTVGEGVVVSKDGATPTLNYTGVIPLSLNMKEKAKDSTKGGKKSKKSGTAGDGEEETNAESLPPNAVDENGNILVTDYDILCGRGGLTNHHKGNKRFRDIVALHRPDYVRAPKIQKPSVARVIVRAIRNGDPPGRFIKKNEQTGLWEELSDKKAAEKTSQALREKTSEEKQGIVPPGFTSPTLILPTAEGGVAVEDGTVPKVDGVKTETNNQDMAKDEATATTTEEGKDGMEVDAPGEQELKKDESTSEVLKEEMAVEI